MRIAIRHIFFKALLIFVGLFSMLSMVNASTSDSIIVHLLSELHSRKSEVPRVQLHNDLFKNYYKSGQLDNAIFHLDSAIVIANRSKNDTLLSKYLNNKSMYYLSIHEFGKALEIANHSLELKRKLQDNLGVVNTLMNIGVINKKKGVYDSALVAYKKAIHYQESHNKESLLHKVYNNVGNIHYLKSNYDSAEIYYRQSLDIAIKQKDKYEESRIRQNLIRLYVTLEDAERINLEWEQAIKVERQLFSTENQVKIAELEGLLENERQQAMIAHQEARIFRIWLFVIGCLAIIFILLAIVYITHQRNQKNILELEAQKQINEAQEKANKAQRLGVLQYIQGQEDERKNIAMGLHNDLNHSFMSALMSDQKDYYLKEALGKFNAAVARVFSEPLRHFGIDGVMYNLQLHCHDRGAELCYNTNFDEVRFATWIESVIFKIFKSLIDIALDEEVKEMHLYLNYVAAVDPKRIIGDPDINFMVNEGRMVCLFEITLLAEGIKLDLSSLPTLTAGILASLGASIEADDSVTNVKILLDHIKIERTIIDEEFSYS